MNSHKPILVFGYGNPSRGDDALGPALVSLLEQHLQTDHGLSQRVALLTDYQLQVEHAMDLVDREQVIFTDASLSAEEPFAFSRLEAEKDTSYTTHAMSPAAILHVYQQLHDEPAPSCSLLSIRGRMFELGQPLSATAEANLRASYRFLIKQLSGNNREP